MQQYIIYFTVVIQIISIITVIVKISTSASRTQTELSFRTIEIQKLETLITKQSAALELLTGKIHCLEVNIAVIQKQLEKY